MPPSHTLIHIITSLSPVHFLLLLLSLFLPSLSTSATPPPTSTSSDDPTPALIARLLHSAAAFRYGLPPNHTYDPTLFYRPSFTSSSPSLFSPSPSSTLFSLHPTFHPLISPRSPPPPQSLPSAISLYNEAAALNSSFALLSLAEIFLFGEASSSIDIPTALPLLFRAADLGSPRSQHLLATLYSTGLGLSQSTAHSILFDYFAALADDPLALMTMGYRHSIGDGVPRSCEAAVGYYHRVARRVITELEADPVSQILEKVRLQGEGGGEGGRSVVTAEVEEDLLLYYRHAAEQGDTSAQLSLANVLFYGTHGLAPDYPTAAHYFRQAAIAGDVQAKTQLAFMQAHGIGVVRNEAAAYRLLHGMISSGKVTPPSAFNLMGKAYELGWGVDVDDVAALAFYQQAADLKHAEGEYNAGRLIYEGRGGVARSPQKAMELWVRCAQQSHTLCMYHLASLYRQGQGVEVQSCDLSLTLYKAVSERGRWGFAFLSAHRKWSIGDVEAALLFYIRLASEGHEIAQSNAAFLLHYGYGVNALRRASVNQSAAAVYHHRHALALQLFTRSALQGYAPSHRMLGDYAYYGLPPHEGVDYEAALLHYTHAAQGGDAHASYNVGWLMEWVRGDWVEARRWYEGSAGKKGEGVAVVWAAKARMEAHRAIIRIWKWMTEWGGVDENWQEWWRVYEDWENVVLLIAGSVTAWLVGLHRHRWRRR